MAEVETLEPSLKLMVEDYAEYAGMSNLSVAGFQFKLTATNPTNPSATQFGLFRWSFLKDIFNVGPFAGIGVFFVVFCFPAFLQFDEVLITLLLRKQETGSRVGSQND